MSVLKIKNKIIRRHWNPQKDLQSTSHSLKAPSSLNIAEIKISYFGTPVSHSHVYDHRSHDQISPLEQRSIQHRSQYAHKNVNWTYTTPQFYKTNQPVEHGQNITNPTIKKPETILISEQTQPNTPKSTKLSYLAELRRKTINNLGDANTVESKYLITATPHQVLQQSELVFKGSRDVGKIVPIKLVYQDQQEPKSIQIHSKRQISDFNLNLIKKSNEICSLVSLSDSNMFCSLVRIQNSFCLQHITHQSLLEIFYKRKTQQVTYLIGQPYQYTLSELYEHKRINSTNVSVICKHIQAAVSVLCKERYSFFDIQGLENTIFYIHGKFKLLPIYAKGKIQAVKTFNQVMEEIESYLLSLSN